MNQAAMQFTFDLQIFAEDAPAAAETPTADVAAQPEAQQPENVTDAPAQAEQQAEVQPEKHISEMTDEEQTEYIKRHFLDDEPTQQDKPEVAQAEQQAAEVQQPEPLIEITVNGEKKQVTQSELIALAQKGEDYTRKTQALAQQRREFEAQVNQYRQMMAQPQQMQQPQQPQVSPQERLQADYRQAVDIAARNLGIKPEDFNSFDPVHAFALQNVIVQANMQAGRQMTEQQAVRATVQEFGEEIKRDPLTPKISEVYEEWILRRGLESKEGAAAAQAVAMAYSRFNAGNPTRQDCKVLKEHWQYVKQKLTQPTPQAAPAKPVVTPPKTEAPGVGRSAGVGSVLDKNKLRALASDPDRQMAYMKSLGIFNE